MGFKTDFTLGVKPSTPESGEFAVWLDRNDGMSPR
jgi:hypothetical protein